VSPDGLAGQGTLDGRPILVGPRERTHACVIQILQCSLTLRVYFLLFPPFTMSRAVAPSTDKPVIAVCGATGKFRIVKRRVGYESDY
jgi:hypothetical protein